MKLSPAAELAVRGILVLAQHYGQGPVTLESICSRRELPRQYLTKIFAALTKAGLITPIRGKGGGYVLGRTPTTISLLQVIEAVEGPLVLNLCQHEPSKCEDVGCKIRPVWADIQATLRSKLGSVSLAVCLADGHKK